MNKKNIHNIIAKINLKKPHCVLFESEIVKEIKKIYNLEIEYFNDPEYIEVNNVEIKINKQNIFIKKYNKGKKCIEPILIKNPNILEIYYKIKNIKIKKINKNDFSSHIENILSQEKFNFLKSDLCLRKDELKTN